MDLWKTPERVVLVTSNDTDGVPHVITVGWKMRTSFKPPMLAIAINNNRYIHRCISDTGEFVLAVPGADRAETTLGCGLPREGDEDRFEKFSLKTEKAGLIKSPLLIDCVANFECHVVNQIETGDHTVFVGDVLASWVNEKPGKNLIIAGESEGYELLAENEPYKIGVIK
jgi:flavin reductase (DIM6/NTAB) family NADH-FMN oxidoreductase RutF